MSPMTINPGKRKATSARSISPYTIRDLDAAITHLERVKVNDSALAIFASTSRRSRIRQVEATPGVMPAQLRRLKTLLTRLDHATRAANEPRQAARYPQQKGYLHATTH
ncbi:hypothetical protein P3T17_002413 [Paraburkholderia sp. GAS82]